MTEGAAAASGVPHEETLLAFTEALVSGEEQALMTARERVVQELGPVELVDAAAVASNFERMVRIADATGIPLDNFLDKMTVDIRAELNLARFTLPEKA